MRLKTVSAIMLTLLLSSVLPLVLNVQKARASQSPPPEWTRTFGGPDTDLAYSVVQTSDGGYALAGSTYSYGAGDNVSVNDDAWLVKIDLSGNHEWNKTYGGTNRDGANSIVETSDGGYALAGYTWSFGEGGDDAWLVKVDSSGNHQWNLTLGGEFSDSALSLVETVDGGYALAGRTQWGVLGQYIFWLVKIDSLGNVTWSRTYGTDGADEAWSVVETSDGGYALAGYMTTPNTDRDFYLVKTNSSGHMQWNRTYGGAYHDLAKSVVETVDGGYMLTGYTQSFGEGGDAWLVKVDSSGNHQWNLTYGGAYQDTANSLVETVDGGYALAGSTMFSGGNNSDFWLVKVDSFGNVQWNETYGGANLDVAYSVVETVDGGYALTGKTWSYGAGESDAWLVKVAGAERPPTRYPWSMFHSDLRHTGYTRSPAPNTNQTKWINTTGGEVRSSPAVAYGRVYVGSNDNKVYCFDAFNGTLLWNYPTGGAVSSSPAVAYGRVYVGSNNFLVYCLDAATGALIWKNTTGGAVSSSPAVAYGRVYVGANDSRIHCFDAATGTLIWDYPTGGRVVSSPAVAEGRVYVGSTDRNVTCLDASTGTLVWNYPTGGIVVSSPAVADGKVYVGSGDGSVYCFNALTGTKLWEYPTGGPVESSPAVASGKVYVGSGDNRTYCLDASTGTQIWNFTMGGIVVSSPAVADGKVYVGSNDAKVYCLNASTREKIWSLNTGGAVTSSPAVADGMVFVGSNDYTVYALGNVIRVPEDFPDIYAAYNASTPWTTIWAKAGIYSLTKPLIIDKHPVALLSKRGSSGTFDGGGDGTAVIILPEGSGSIVAGIEITNFDRGICIMNASNCKIYDNVLSHMDFSGMFLEGDNVTDNQIYSNIFQDNTVAINSTKLSTSNTIYDNTFSLNIIGLNLVESSGNTIYSNTITQNVVGINISSSGGNTIYHNNFINNTQQVTVASLPNTWDNGYAIGGNYWSDHTCTGNPSDGGEPCEISEDGNNTDHYPFQNPDGWLLSSIAGDINQDGIVNIIDIVICALAFDSRPGDDNWDPRADVRAEYNLVNIVDIVFIALRFDETGP